MLTGVEVITDHVFESLVLPLQEPDDPYERLEYPIREITGLNPVGAEIKQSGFAQVDGVKTHGARRDGRNIVITLGLNPDYSLSTVQSLREKLYRYFMPKTKVELRFHDDAAATKMTSGIVETFETELFTDDPEIQISILTEDSDFSSAENFSETKQSTPLGTTWQLEYGGSVPTGIIFTVSKPSEIVNAFYIEVAAPGAAVQRFYFTGQILTTDVLTLDANPGKQFIRRTRSGKTTSALGDVTLTNSTWPKLYPGTNNIRVYYVGVDFDYTISWSNRYGGL